LQSTLASAISEDGAIAGYGACGGGNDRALAAWDGSQFITLNLTTTFWSQASDVNSNSQVVGTRELTGLGVFGFLHQNGQTVNLPWLDGHNWSEAHSISEYGTVIGFSSNVQTGPQIACRWFDGEVEALSLPIAGTSSAEGINARHQIVGFVGNPTQAFLWQDGIANLLPSPILATSYRAVAINSQGVTCGSCSKPNPDGGPSLTIPILWPNETELIELGLVPTFIRCAARDLNDANTVVGNCQNPPQLGNTLQGFVWRDGMIKSLDDLLETGSAQYHVKRAVSINDAGQIAADVQGPEGSRVARLIAIPPRPGDTNCDWLVNVTDLLAVINAWGAAPPQIPFEGSPDLTTDGSVNVLDLLAVINDWG
jgi:uncharacterized membrane protein